MVCSEAFYIRLFCLMRGPVPRRLFHTSASTCTHETHLESTPSCPSGCNPSQDAVRQSTGTSWLLGLPSFGHSFLFFSFPSVLVFKILLFLFLPILSSFLSRSFFLYDFLLFLPSLSLSQQAFPFSPSQNYCRPTPTPPPPILSLMHPHTHHYLCHHHHHMPHSYTTFVFSHFLSYFYFHEAKEYIFLTLFPSFPSNFAIPFHFFMTNSRQHLLSHRKFFCSTLMKFFLFHATIFSASNLFSFHHNLMHKWKSRYHLFI